MSIKDSLRILVVDDMAASRGVLINGLEQCGIKNIFSETTCDGALSFMLKTPVHLVVSDYNMPGMSGLELARELRALHPGRPVAITSGFIAEELRRLAPAAGIADLIPKPNTCEELFDAIERLASRVCRPALP